MYFILTGANSEEVADACLLAVCYCDSRVSQPLVVVIYLDSNFQT